MLKIKKSKVREEWIVYNPDNFELHTHCNSQRVAVAIKRTVEHKEIPRSHNLKFIESCIRLTRDKKYLKVLNNIAISIKYPPGMKKIF